MEHFPDFWDFCWTQGPWRYHIGIFKSQKASLTPCNGVCMSQIKSIAFGEKLGWKGKNTEENMTARRDMYKRVHFHGTDWQIWLLYLSKGSQRRTYTFNTLPALFYCNNTFSIYLPHISGSSEWSPHWLDPSQVLPHEIHWPPTQG